MTDARFVKCRALGHSWNHTATIGIDDDHGRPRPFGGFVGMVGFVSRCSVCGSERVRWVTRSGASHSRYEYAEGYTTKGEGRTPNATWRSSFVEKLFEGFGGT